VVDEFMTAPSIEMTAAAFGDWMNRLQRVIDGKSEYIT
jgi:hypothetical protein